MAQPVLTLASQANCPHGGKTTFTSSATKVLFDSAPPLIAADRGSVVGCSFTVPTGKPQPCTVGLVTQAATKVLVEGKPVILQSPGDMGQSAEQIPQGPLSYTQVQTKVVAT